MANMRVQNWEYNLNLLMDLCLNVKQAVLIRLGVDVFG